jgi:hypothetical protein
MRTDRISRIGGALLVAGAVLTMSLPALAQSGNYSGHCRRITKQIVRYEGQIDMAQSQGNAVWEAATGAHVTRLRQRRSRLCPEYDQWVVAAAARKQAAEIAALLKLAGSAALSYFTAGAY